LTGFFPETYRFVQGGGGILRYYKGGAHKALADLFPEVEFDSLRFHKTPRMFGERGRERLCGREGEAL
jgi:hypothetical protein